MRFYYSYYNDVLKADPKTHRQTFQVGEMLCFSSFSVVVLSLFVSYVHCSHDFTRYNFPTDFVFGAGSSAYQVEGAATEDGRTPSIWDKYAEAASAPGGIGHEVKTSDQYHKYKEDVKLMVDAGLDAYRLSISWSRLIPNGRGPINPKGLEYYNKLLDDLNSNGIEPHVTLHHSDHPQFLEDEYGGWLDRKMVEDFTTYANVCFHHFGDRVKHWTTLNEANVFILVGYDFGSTPPQRCTPNFVINCTRGNSSTEPYLAGHNMMLAHASAVKLYKDKYQGKQNGLIGINLFGFNFYPKTESVEDAVATQRAKDFLLGWFMNPLNFGDYPNAMKDTVGPRLPNFTPEESEMVKGSYDFIALNHYYSIATSQRSSSWYLDIVDLTSDMGVDLNFESPAANEDPLSSEFPIQPWGLSQLLKYFQEAYGNPPIYIHENGQQTSRNVSRSMAMNDTNRVEYMRSFIGSLLDAVRNGSNTKGYFVWSLLDMVELLSGYKSSFGLYYIDFINDHDLARYPKLSAHWYSNFLKGGVVVSSDKISGHGSINMLRDSSVDIIASHHYLQ